MSQKRIIRALAETQDMLDRALAYMPQHRDQRLIAFCRGHIGQLSVILRQLTMAPDPDPGTLGPDEPHPGGTPHDEWVELERKCQAEARKHFDVV